jgi:hypothetical protein
MKRQLITLRIDATYLIKDVMAIDATTRAELELLLLSYTKPNLRRFTAVHSLSFSCYMCSRCDRLRLHAAKLWINKFLGYRYGTLFGYLIYRNAILGGRNLTDNREIQGTLRKKFLQCILAGKTEFKILIPIVEAQDGHKS